MATITQHTPGAPCWFELGTTDQSAGKQFYSQLFHWSSVEIPMGPGSTYTIFQQEGKDTGAAYTLMPEQTAQGIPPHWMVYFHTPDCDASAAKAAELGATVIMPPMDVYDSVRIAMLKDPAGAVVALCQPRNHKGVGVWNEMNSIGWTELITPDPENAIAFYTALLGWTTKPSSNAPGVYTEFYVDGQPKGGIMKMGPEFGPMPPCWTIYMLVSDCDATAAKAAELGGSTCHGPFDAQGVGRIGVMNDPQGAMFNIIQLFAPMH